MPGLHRIGHREDDVVIGGRTIKADISGQRDDTVLRTFHRRKLVDRRFQGAPRADCKDDRIGGFQPAFDFRRTGLGNTCSRGQRAGIAWHDVHLLQTVSFLETQPQFQAGRNRMVETNLDQAFGHGEGNKPLRRLPRYAHGAGDLVLGAAGHIIEPACPRGIVEPVIAFRSARHCLCNLPAPQC